MTDPSQQYRQIQPRPGQPNQNAPRLGNGWGDIPQGRPQYAPANEGPATTALTLGIIAIFLNVFFVPGILAIVFGAKALDRRYTDGRSKAGWGLGLGIAATVFSFILMVAILSAL